VRGYLGLFVVVLLLAPGIAEARDRRTLAVRDPRTGHVLRLQPFGRYGHVTHLAQARLDRLFASRHSGAQRRVHPRLFRLLVQVERHFGGVTPDVYSAYRAPQDPNGPHGYHGLARAADVRLEPVTARAVFEYCRTLRATGCGLYPNESFTHIDARPRSTIWVDLSIGRGNDYVAAAADWLKAHPAAGRGRPAHPYHEGGGAAFAVDRSLDDPYRRGRP
jgi:uncharacterized protein YcbK (DUF882 family)